jgi:hypothetical protein
LFAAPVSFEMSAAAAVPSTPLRPITQDPKILLAPERKNRSRVAPEAGAGNPNTQRKLEFGQHPGFVALFISLAMSE